jgi:hypothetical protein
LKAVLSAGVYDLQQSSRMFRGAKKEEILNAAADVRAMANTARYQIERLGHWHRLMAKHKVDAITLAYVNHCLVLLPILILHSFVPLPFTVPNSHSVSLSLVP